MDKLIDDNRSPTARSASSICHVQNLSERFKKHKPWKKKKQSEVTKILTVNAVETISPSIFHKHS